MYTVDERKILLNVARQSIAFGLSHHRPLGLKVEDYSLKLREMKASFVTLEIHKQLRGCIGSLEVYRPLVHDVASNAYAAAFQDPRFYPLSQEEYDDIHIHISILDQPQPMHFQSEEDLINQLRVGVDGLILSEEGGYRGTFLPAVWESLPTPREFLSHLKLKAGLSADYWSDSIRVERYTVESVE